MDWIAIASVVVAVISAAYSAGFARRSEESQERAAVNHYRSEVRAWAARAIHKLVWLEAASRREVDPQELDSALVELSALIDEGRLFFPNSRVGGKDPAFGERKKDRGYRDKKLDPLVAVHFVFRTESDVGNIPDIILVGKLRILFTRRIQEFLDPTNISKKLCKIMRIEEGEETEMLLRRLGNER